MGIVINDIWGTPKFTCEGDCSFRTVIEDAVGRGVNLSSANLCDKRLRGAHLSNARFRDASLRNADLYNADLRNADLRGADLYNANLRNADLSGADLYGANLIGADLYDADLRYALSVPYIPMACPSDGAFVGWKKVAGKLIKLLIPEDAKRSSATTNKCRCDKAKVLSITDVEGKNPISRLGRYAFGHETIYEVGEMVYPDSFDDDRWNECSHGIHFFINKQDAINYL